MLVIFDLVFPIRESLYEETSNEAGEFDLTAWADLTKPRYFVSPMTFQFQSDTSTPGHLRPYILMLWDPFFCSASERCQGKRTHCVGFCLLPGSDARR